MLGLFLSLYFHCFAKSRYLTVNPIAHWRFQLGRSLWSSKLYGGSCFSHVTPAVCSHEKSFISYCWESRSLILCINPFRLARSCKSHFFLELFLWDDGEFFSFFFSSSWTRTRSVEDVALFFVLLRRKVEGEKIFSFFAFLPSRKSSHRKVPDEWSLGKKGGKEKLCSFQMTTDGRQMNLCRLQMNLDCLQMFDGR